MELSRSDIELFERAVELAEKAGESDNLPIGAVIGLDGSIIAEGRNAIWFPGLSPDRHAEIEALRRVPHEVRERLPEMTLYTTLEPCVMCLGAILLHRVGRVLYGAADPYGGATRVIGHMPTYFEDQASRTEWLGPAYPEACDPLCERVIALVARRRAQELADRR